MDEGERERLERLVPKTKTHCVLELLSGSLHKDRGVQRSP